MKSLRKVMEEVIDSRIRKYLCKDKLTRGEEKLLDLYIEQSLNLKYGQTL